MLWQVKQHNQQTINEGLMCLLVLRHTKLKRLTRITQGKVKGKFILTSVLTLECSGDLKRIQLEVQVLGYSIYTILAKTYQSIECEPEIRR